MKWEAKRESQREKEKESSSSNSSYFYCRDETIDLPLNGRTDINRINNCVCERASERKAKQGKEKEKEKERESEAKDSTEYRTNSLSSLQPALVVG